ncbi:hypothetical protein [Runella sp.]
MKNTTLPAKRKLGKRAYSKPTLSTIGSVKKLTQKTGSQTDIFTSYTA